MVVIIDGKRIPIVVAKSFYKRLMGLMFKKKKIDYGICFPMCTSIHTFFMYQNIDVLMTDKNDIITGIYKDIKKNRIINGHGYYTYEFASGTISNLRIGDQLKKEA